MKSIKVKLKDDNSGLCTIQQDDVKPGNWSQGVITYQIVNIPDEIETAEVLRLVNATTFLAKRYIFDFNELGQGVIIKSPGRPSIDYIKNSINTENGNPREDDLIQQVRDAIKKLRKDPDLVAKIELYKRA